MQFLDMPLEYMELGDPIMVMYLYQEMELLSLMTQLSSCNICFSKICMYYIWSTNLKLEESQLYNVKRAKLRFETKLMISCQGWRWLSGNIYLVSRVLPKTYNTNRTTIVWHSLKLIGHYCLELVQSYRCVFLNPNVWISSMQAYISVWIESRIPYWMPLFGWVKGSFHWYNASVPCHVEILVDQ